MGGVRRGRGHPAGSAPWVWVALRVVLASLVRLPLVSSVWCGGPARGDGVERLMQVHVVMHSHTDPGWKLTAEEEQNEAGLILEGVLAALEVRNAPSQSSFAAHRTFTGPGEVYFLEAALRDYPDFAPRIAALSSRGALDLVGGAWVQQDEASSTLAETLLNVRLGRAELSRLLGQFDAKLPVRTAYQIDSFGHSELLRDVLIASGEYTGIVLNRVGGDAKRGLKRAKGLDFWWTMDEEGPGTHGQLQATVLFDHYTPPRGMEPVVTNPVPGGSEDAQLVGRVSRALAAAARSRARVLNNGGHVLVVVGDDFRMQGEDALSAYALMDAVLERLARDPAAADLCVGYSTVSAYFQGVAAHDGGLVRHSGGFMPYAEDMFNVWTGFYAGRPRVKQLRREAQASLHAAMSLNALALLSGGIGSEVGDENSSSGCKGHWISAAARPAATASHHDGITGTCSSLVADDFAALLVTSTSISRACAETSVGLGLQEVLPTSVLSALLDDPPPTYEAQRSYGPRPISERKMEQVPRLSMESQGRALTRLVLHRNFERSRGTPSWSAEFVAFNPLLQDNHDLVCRDIDMQSPEGYKRPEGDALRVRMEFTREPGRRVEAQVVTYRTVDEIPRSSLHGHVAGGSTYFREQLCFRPGLAPLEAATLRVTVSVGSAEDMKFTSIFRPVGPGQAVTLSPGVEVRARPLGGWQAGYALDCYSLESTFHPRLLWSVGIHIRSYNSAKTVITGSGLYLFRTAWLPLLRLTILVSLPASMLGAYAGRLLAMQRGFRRGMRGKDMALASRYGPAWMRLLAGLLRGAPSLLRRTLSPLSSTRHKVPKLCAAGLVLGFILARAVPYLPKAAMQGRFSLPMDTCASPCKSLDLFVAAVAALISGLISAATADGSAGASSAPGLPQYQVERRADAATSGAPLVSVLWHAFLLNMGLVAGSQWALLARPALLSVPMRPPPKFELDYADGPLFAVLRLQAGPVTHHVRMDKSPSAGTSPAYALSSDTSVSSLAVDTEFALWLSSPGASTQRLLLSDGNAFREVPYVASAHLERNAHPLVDCAALGRLGVVSGHAVAVSAPRRGTLELRLARSLSMDDEKGLDEVGAGIDSSRPLQHASVSIFPALIEGGKADVSQQPEVVLSAAASELLNPTRVYASTTGQGMQAALAKDGAWWDPTRGTGVRFQRDSVPEHLEVTVVEPAGPDVLRLTVRNRSPSTPLRLLLADAIASDSGRRLLGWARDPLLLDALDHGGLPRKPTEVRGLNDASTAPAILQPLQIEALRLVFAPSSSPGAVQQPQRAGAPGPLHT